MAVDKNINQLLAIAIFAIATLFSLFRSSGIRLVSHRFRAGIPLVAVCLFLPGESDAQKPEEQIRRGYEWAANVAIAAPEQGKQKCETAMTTDAKGRVWLSYLEGDYKQVNGTWLAFPRRVVLLSSDDQGYKFGNRHLLSESGTDQSLVVGPTGDLCAVWVQFPSNSKAGSGQKILFSKHQDGGTFSDPCECLPFEANMRHDQAHIHVGADGVIHVLGMNIGTNSNKKQNLLYARSTNGGQSFSDTQRLEGVGALPQLASTAKGLLIAGPAGYVTSSDNGRAFGAARPRIFGQGLARIAVSNDRKTAYVVGDSVGGGLFLHVTEDLGKSWRKQRVDSAVKATAWRYPAIHVEKAGRLHIVWLDNREGRGNVYHTYSDDRGRSFTKETRVSDARFALPADAPPPPPATQNGTWIGDYLSLTTAGDKVIVAWSDQRAGATLSAVYKSVGKHGK